MRFNYDGPIFALTFMLTIPKPTYMKQFYILALGGLLSLGAQAQYNMPAAAKGDTSPRAKVTAVTSNVERETIWINDVSVCDDWTYGNGATETGSPWFDIDINFECTTEGPSGPYNGWAGGNAVGTPQPPLNSSTSDNGFLMVDSDLFGADANYDANWIENCWVQTADAIDCANYPYVSISFQTRYRCWDNGASDGSEKCFVEVSRDGTSWPELTSAYTTEWSNEGMVDYDGEMVQCRYEVFPDSETGYGSDNPALLEFDITEAAGGQEAVWVRFRWVGTWGYSWEIDDIEVYETPENDTRIDNYVSYTNFEQGGNYEYGAWAVSQLPDTLFAGAKVYNVGYANQTNVVIDLDVNGESVVSNVIDTLGYAANDTLVAAYTVTGLGPVSLDYTLSADDEDENPGNNTASQSFEVTDLQWGRDNGEISAAYPAGDPTEGDIAGTTDYIAMPLYFVENDVTIYGVDVAIMEGTEPNIPVRGFLVDINDDLALTEQYGGELVSSPEIDLVEGNTNDGTGEIIWYTFVFDEPYEATAGENLGAAFEHYGGGNVQIGEAQFTYDQTAFVYGPFGSGQAYDWYYSNEVPMVRLNLDADAVTAVSEAQITGTEGFDLFPAFPNPTTDATRFRFQLERSAEVTFELRDIAGKLVERRDLGTQPAGMGNMVLETSAFGAGSYTATFVVDGARTTQKLMVK